MMIKTAALLRCGLKFRGGSLKFTCNMNLKGIFLRREGYREGHEEESCEKVKRKPLYILNISYVSGGNI